MTLEGASLEVQPILSCHSLRMSREGRSLRPRQTMSSVTVRRVSVLLFPRGRPHFQPTAHGPPSRPMKFVYKLPYGPSSSLYGTFWPQRIVNRQTVHHSWSLFERNKGAHPEDAYGDEFRYDECLRTPGPISALFAGFSICLFVLALLVSPVRWLGLCHAWSKR